MSVKPEVVRQQQSDQLYDGDTGEHVGQIDLFGREQYHLRRAEQQHLVAPGNLSGVTYDTGGRAIAWSIDGVAYTATYSASGITITGSDGYLREIALDPLGRIDASILMEV